MPIFEGTDDSASPAKTLLVGKRFQPLTFDKWIQTNLTDTDGNNDLRSVLADIKASAESGGAASSVLRDVEKLQHLTRDITDDVRFGAWEAAADADGAVAYGIAVNNMINLDNADFTGATGTIPAKTSGGRRLIYIFVRLPVAADRSRFRLVATPGGTIQGNGWAALPQSGVNEANFDRDTYTYWWAETDLDEDAEQALKLEKRVVTLDEAVWNGELGGEAKDYVDDEVAVLGGDVQRSIEALQHLTRDLHDHEDYGAWATAADTDGDLYEADISSSMPTLTDALFNGGGASLVIDENQNDLTQIYIRIAKGVNRNTLSVLLNKGEPYEHRYPGNGWFDSNFQKPTSAVYDYFEVVGFQNGAGTTVELQKRDATSDTTSYGGTVDGATADALPLSGGTLTGPLILAGDPTEDLGAAPKQYADDIKLSDRSDFPAPAGYEVGRIIVVHSQAQILRVTNTATPNLFEGAVGHDTYNTTTSERWRGLSTNAHPNGFATDGAWEANPDNAVPFLMASNMRRIRWAVKKSVYETAKGSAFSPTDKLAIRITYADNTTDEAVGSYFNTYAHYENGVDVQYIQFGHRQSEDDGNYALATAEDGATFSAEFFTVDGDGNATTTHFLTHAVATKHWVVWVDAGDTTHTAEDALRQSNANAARLDALDSQVDGNATPVHELSVDDTTDLAPHNQHVAWSQTWNDVTPDTLVVIDWEGWQHLGHHAEHSLPGSTPASGRMYVGVNEFDLSADDGEFGFASDDDGVNQKPRLQSDTSQTVQSSLLTDIQYASGTGQFVFSLRYNQVNNGSNARLYAPEGFRFTVRLFKNTSILTATEGSLHAQIKALQDAPPVAKGDSIATITGLSGGGLVGQSWTLVDTTNASQSNSTGAGWSDYLHMDVHHFLNFSVGTGLVFEVTRTGVTGPVSQVYLPFSSMYHDLQVLGGYWATSGTDNNDRIEIDGRTDTGTLDIRASCAGADTDGTLTVYVAK